MKLSYRQRLFVYFAGLFVIFTVGIAFYERQRELSFKREALEEKLDTYSDIIQSVLQAEREDLSGFSSHLPPVIPHALRITIIDKNGAVLFDNYISNTRGMENHLNREEIRAAAEKGTGSDVRQSVSNQRPYLYYAKNYSDEYIRVAMPYDIRLKQFLKADNTFLYFLVGFLIVFLWLIYKITSQFGASVRRLRDFALQTDQTNISHIRFPDDELGEIGNKISENYLQLEASRKNIALEKQKLLQHIQISEEGICFASADHKIEFYNGLFIQYLNQLTEEPSSDAASVFTDAGFAPLHQFLKEGSEDYFETEINRHGKIFSLQVNVFTDRSFEILLNDITRREKTRRLKQEMTGNIAHELRTPVTGIRAYLETVLQQNIPDDKKEHFIRQAYNQTLTLSEILKDMSLIAKMGEAPESFLLEEVNIDSLLSKLKADLSLSLSEKQIEMRWQLPQNLVVRGNMVLLYSVFNNLTENAIRYAGERIKINVSVFNEDKEYYYFSFFDTGAGIDNEEHLNRIFERFYRVQGGRTRDTGGSGLGLSIVNNAIQFHGGTIAARNRKGGGLEFLFRLRK